jgi:hypothetical protein
MASNPAKPEKKIAQQVDYLNSWWPGAESNHRHKDFQLSDRPYFRFLPYKVNPTIGKLCAQNFLGCLYGVDLVGYFDPHKEYM